MGWGRRSRVGLWGWVLLAALAQVGCAGSRGRAFGPADYPSSLDRGRFARDEAVVLEDRGHLALLRDGKSWSWELTTHEKILVLQPSGRSVGTVHRTLGGGRELVKLVGRSYGPPTASPNGAPRVFEADPDQVAIRSTVSGSYILFSDARVAELEIPGVQVGSVVEYESVVRSANVFDLPAWYFDGAHPVLDSSLTVEVPPDVELAWSYVERGRPAAIEPQVRRTSAGGQEVTFQRTDLEPYVRPELERGERRRGRTLSLTLARGPDLPSLARWSDMGPWYAKLAAGRDASVEAAKQLVDTLNAPVQLADLAAKKTDPHVDGAAAYEGATRPPSLAVDVPISPAEHIYRWVRNRIRYVAMYEPLGHVRPHPASDVFAAGFGDCKDKANLLVTFYRQAGIEAYPALIGVKRRDVFDPVRPKLWSFDHMIVALRRSPEAGGTKEGWYFVDPTARWGSFAILPRDEQDREVLVLHPDHAELVRTPTFDPERSIEARTWTIDRARPRVKLDLDVKGSDAARWRALAWDGARSGARERALRELWLGPTTKARVLEVSAERERPDDEVHFGAELEGPPSLVTLGAERVLRLADVFPRPPRPKETSNDQAGDPDDERGPRLGRGLHRIERVVLPLLAGEKVIERPKDVEAKLSIGTYARRVRVTADAIVVERELVLRPGRASAGEEDALDSWRAHVDADARSAVVITASSVVAEGGR